jgi:hypothetical protein
MPSDQFEIPTTVKTDGNNDEYYVAVPELPAIVNLADVVFLIFHPREGESRGTMVIKPRSSIQDRRPRRSESVVTRGSVVPGPSASGTEDEVLYSEVKRCEEHFAGTGYVGLGYFLTAWKSAIIPSGVEARKPILDRLISKGWLELYRAADGKDAIRTAR